MVVRERRPSSQEIRQEIDRLEGLLQVTLAREKKPAKKRRFAKLDGKTSQKEYYDPILVCLLLCGGWDNTPVIYVMLSHYMRHLLTDVDRAERTCGGEENTHRPEYQQAARNAKGELVKLGYVVWRRVGGRGAWMLTDSGRARAEELLANLDADTKSALIHILLGIQQVRGRRARRTPEFDF